MMMGPSRVASGWRSGDPPFVFFRYLVGFYFLRGAIIEFDAGDVNEKQPLFPKDDEVYYYIPVHM